MEEDDDDDDEEEDVSDCPSNIQPPPSFAHLLHH